MGSSLAVNGAVTGNDGSSIAVNGGQLTVGVDITNGYYDTLTISSGTAAISGNITNNDDNISLNSGILTVGGTITNNGYDNINVSGGWASIGGITNNGWDDNLNVSGGVAAVTGNITNTYVYDILNISGGAAEISGSITNTGWEDNIYVSSGTLTVGGAVANQDSYIQVWNGGSAQFGGLAQSGWGVYVDPGSVLEIGSAGGAAAGALTIDSGITVTASNGAYFEASSIVDNGVIDVTSGSFALDGNLTGSGAVDIGSGASVTLTGVNAASANTVAFTGTNGILTLNYGALNAPTAFTVSGFNPSDVIEVQGTVTGASYNNGVLTLTDGTTAVNQLTLAGNYTGDAFAATPLNNGYTQISVSSGGNTATAPAGTGQGDSFVWGSNIAGSWDNAANWNDTSGGGQSPASVAPGSTDFVTINQAASGATNVITGVGNSASLTIGGATVLQGQFTTGALVLQDNAPSSIGPPSNGSLTVNGSVTGNDSSSMAVNGGQLTIGGDITNGESDNLNVRSGTATIAGSINNYYDDSLNVSGGTAAITGNITNNFYYDSLNVSGGFFTATPVSNGYTQINVSSGGDTTTAPGGTGKGELFCLGLGHRRQLG